MFHIREQIFQHRHNVFTTAGVNYSKILNKEDRGRLRQESFSPRQEEHIVPRRYEFPISRKDKYQNLLKMNPESVIQRIRKNYIRLKEDITPIYIIDALVAGDVISSNEDETIKKRTREEGADIILKKILRDKRNVKCFIETLEEHGYPFLVKKIIEEDNGNMIQRTPTEHDMGDTLSDYEIMKRLKQNEKFLVEELDVLQYIDHFLQEDIFTVNDHDDIVMSSDRRRGALASLFLSKLRDKIPRSYYFLVKVLKEKGRHYIVRKLEETVVDETLEQNVLDVAVKMKNATIYGSPRLDASTNVTALRLVISKCPQGERNVYCKLEERIPGSEETICHILHATVSSSKIGSLTIYLQVESSDFQSQLCQSVKNDSISELLRQLFDHCDVTSILDEEVYDLEVVIETCNKNISETVMRGTLQRLDPCRYTGWKRILWQNFSLLKEEFEPLSLSDKLEEKGICVRILKKLGTIPRRRERVDEILKELMDQTENKISSFLKLLKEYGGHYIKEHLDIRIDDDENGNQQLDIDVIRKNVLDNITFLMDELDVSHMESDFVCKEVLTQTFFTELTQRDVRRRDRVRLFLKTVLDIGKPAIEVFISSLCSHCYNDIVDVLLKDSSKEDKMEQFVNDANIKYDFFDVKRGLLFQGNFVLTVSKPDEERSVRNTSSKDGENTSSETESKTQALPGSTAFGADDGSHSAQKDSGIGVSTSTPSVDDSESTVTDSDTDESTSTNSDTDASCLCDSFSSSTSNYSSYSEEYEDTSLTLKRKSNDEVSVLDNTERERLETESAKLQGILTVALRDSEIVQMLICTFQKESIEESKILIENLLGQNAFNMNKDSIYKLQEIDFQLRHNGHST